VITAEFLLTSLIVVLIPGTGVVFTISTGLGQGRRASVFAALGCTAGILPHLLATVLGLAAVMHTSAVAFQVLKYAGVAYLLYIAYGVLAHAFGRAVVESPRVQAWVRRGFATIFAGLGVNLALTER
jgi:threonine/homoserine/homoserine lactone efflux protein